MHLALYALSSVVAVWFVATSLVAIRRGLMGRDLELSLAAVGQDDLRPVRARAQAPTSIATAA
jgi:hypothetical protein